MPTFAIHTESPAVKGPPQGKWTYDDWLKLDTEHHRYRYEVIDGYLYVSYVPVNFHQYIVQALFRTIGIPLHDEKGPLQPMFYVGLVMHDTIVVPDFLIAHQRHVRWETYIFGSTTAYSGTPARAYASSFTPSS